MPDQNVDIEDVDDKMAGEGYSWEERYKRSWDVIQEDEHHLLNLNIPRHRKEYSVKLFYSLSL